MSIDKDDQLELDGAYGPTPRFLERAALKVDALLEDLAPFIPDQERAELAQSCRANLRINARLDEIRQGLWRLATQRAIEQGKAIVHVLYHGLPMCGFSSEVPADWPPPHSWVGINDRPKATCGGCDARTKAHLERLADEAKAWSERRMQPTDPGWELVPTPESAFPVLSIGQPVTWHEAAPKGGKRHDATVLEVLESTVRISVKMNGRKVHKIVSRNVVWPK